MLKFFLCVICWALNGTYLKATEIEFNPDFDPNRYAKALRNSKPFLPLTSEETRFIQNVLKGCVEDAQKQFSYTRPSGPATYRVASVTGSPQNLDKATLWRSSSMGAANVLLEFKNESEEPEASLQMKLVAVNSDLS